MSAGRAPSIAPLSRPEGEDKRGEFLPGMVGIGQLRNAKIIGCLHVLALVDTRAQANNEVLAACPFA